MGKEKQLHVRNSNGRRYKTTKKLTTTEFISRSNIVHNNKYNYDNAIYINASTKVEVYCQKHGVFNQRAADHMKGRGCPCCARETSGKKKRLNKEDLINRCNKIHNNKYNYTKLTYKTIRDKGIILCPLHGEFLASISNHLSGTGCKKCYEQYKVHNNKSNTEEFIAKANNIHGNYIYNKTIYTTSDSKVVITCPKHGDFKQKPNAHLNGHGCPICGNIISSKNKIYNYPFIEKAKKIHGAIYDYSNTRYTGILTPVTIICPKHGKFKQTPASHLKGSGCIKCSNNTSKLEDIIETHLTSNNIKFQQHYKINCTYSNMPKRIEFDFYIPDKKLAIEVDGIYWHSEISGNKSRNYHINKTKTANDNNIQLIHIFESDFKNIKLVLGRLDSILGINKQKIYARNCIVKPIDNIEKKRFLTETHFQGNDNASIYIGLFNNDKLYSIMTFGKRRIALGSTHIKNEYELYRFSTISGVNIIGGAGKLLNFFCKTYLPTKIWSFCDRRWSVGNLYKKLGFVLDHESPPNYWYFSNTNKTKLIHRYAFRKNVLNKKLDIFDENDSEWKNMKNNGYDRIWDCGSLVFIFKPNLKT